MVIYYNNDTSTAVIQQTHDNYKFTWCTHAITCTFMLLYIHQVNLWRLTRLSIFKLVMENQDITVE